MTPDIVSAVAGVLGTIAAVVACFQASAAKRAAEEVNITVGSLKLQLDQLAINVTNISHSPLANLIGASISIPGASGGAGGHAGPGGAAGGGGGGSIFGAGGAGGEANPSQRSP